MKYLVFAISIGCWLLVTSPGYSDSPKARQVVLESRFITLSDSFSKRIGVSFDEVDGLNPRGKFDMLIPVRDGLTDLILSTDPANLTGIVLKNPTEPTETSPGDGVVDLGTGLNVEVVGIGEDGRVELKVTPKVKTEIVRLIPKDETGDDLPEGSSRMGKAFGLPPKIVDPDRKASDEELSVGSIEDLLTSLRKLQESQARLRSEYSEIIEAAKKDPSEENSEAAALARRSIQTAIYQRAALEREIGVIIEIAKYMEEQGTFPDITKLPDDHTLRKKMDICETALKTLKDWEQRRMEID